MCGLFDSIFGSSSNTNQTSTTNSSGTGSYSNQGTSAVTPTLDPSMQPLIPQIAGAVGNEFATSVPASQGLSASELATIPGLLGNNYSTTAGLESGINAAALTPSAVSGAISGLQTDPNITYNSSGVPTVSAISGVPQVGANGVDPSTILSNLNPFMQSVVASQMALNQNTDLAQQARLRAQLAGNKSFGDQSQISMNDLIQKQNLSDQSTIANLMSQGYTQAQAQAETDAARAQQAQVSNQGAGLTLGQQSLSAQEANQNAGLTEAQAATAAQIAEAQQKAAQLTAGANLAVGQQNQLLSAINQYGNLNNSYLSNIAGIYGAGQTAAGAPISTTNAAANVVYGSPMGQTGTQQTSGTATSNTTSSSTGSGTKQNNPSLFSDLSGIGSILAGAPAKDGGALHRRYADGGYVSPLPSPIDDWNSGLVYSSDVGDPADAPSDIPPGYARTDLQAPPVMSGAFRQPTSAMAKIGAIPPQRGALPSPSDGAQDDDGGIDGSIAGFLHNMAHSPLARLTGDIFRTLGAPGVVAMQSARARAALEQAQAEMAQEQLRERRVLFPYQEQAINEEYDADSGAGAGTGANFAPSGPGSVPDVIGAPGTPEQPNTAAPGWYQNQLTSQFNRLRRQAMAGIPGAEKAMSAVGEQLRRAIPENYVFDPNSGTVSPAPGYATGEARLAYDKAVAEFGPRAMEAYYRMAGQPRTVNKNESVVQGAMPPTSYPGSFTPPSDFGGPPQVEPQPTVPQAKISFGPGRRPDPAPGARKDPQANAAENGVPGAGFNVVHNPDGSVSSQWNDATTGAIDRFWTAYDEATKGAETAQESDYNVARLKAALADAKAQGTKTGPLTPALAQAVNMAQSVGINTDDIIGKDGKILPSAGAAGAVLTADKAQKIILGRILREMYPQRITNVDIALNKNVAPGPSLPEVANQNLIDAIQAQNQYDKEYADQIQDVAARANPNEMIQFHRNFTRAHGYGPIAGTYYSLNGKGQSIRTPLSTEPPAGVPRNSVDTGRIYSSGPNKGQKAWRAPDGQLYPGGTQ